MSDKARVLIYILRRDLRLADNPIFHELSRLQNQSVQPFTHLLPIYIFPADQIEVGGFISSPAKRSPYPEARSQVAGFWRCGHLRAKFLAESVWDLKQDLRQLQSDLAIRVGTVGDVLKHVLRSYRDHVEKAAEVTEVWMTAEDSFEEKNEERQTSKLCAEAGVKFRTWLDEKYLIDDRDLPFKNPAELSDVFTTFRKTVEPLREAPRKPLPRPGSLPPLPWYIPAQEEPFEIPDSLVAVVSALSSPLRPNLQIPDMPDWPSGAKSAHPFTGGSKTGHERIMHLITSRSMTNYKDTRNGLLGEDYSTKLSAWLTHGSITARQIHWYLVDFEDGKTPLGKDTKGYGKGENKGTAAVRFELLWRDYMRLCMRKFGSRLFKVEGFRNNKAASWKYTSNIYSSLKRGDRSTAAPSIDAVVYRFLVGRTGTGLIDASQKELFLTGYTSNRARQNVASYLAKHLGIDWRIGAEWYECNLVDYDVSSNWGNWQYVAGVGNDPRGEQRVFNPVKQALDYDPKGEYIKAWVPELRPLDADHPEQLMGTFQAWRLGDDSKARFKIDKEEWVERPLVRINFSLNRRGGAGARGHGGGGRGGGDRSRGKARSGEASKEKGFTQ